MKDNGHEESKENEQNDENCEIEYIINDCFDDYRCFDDSSIDSQFSNEPSSWNDQISLHRLNDLKDDSKEKSGPSIIDTGRKTIYSYNL